MKFSYTIGTMVLMGVGQPATALSCVMSSIEEFAVQSNSEAGYMVMGQVDTDFVFDGMIVGAEPPDEAFRIQLPDQFRDAPHPLWGGPHLPTNTPILGPLMRVDEGKYMFVGNLCQLLVFDPTDALVDRVRQCQRNGRCPKKRPIWGA